jgi:hypothetical protein
MSTIRCEFESCSGEVYSIQHSVIKFVSDLRQVGVFFPDFLHQQKTYTLKTFSVIGIYEVDGDERLDVLVVMVYLFSSIYVVRLLVVHHIFCHKIWRSCCIYLLSTDFSYNIGIFLGSHMGLCV